MLTGAAYGVVRNDSVERNLLAEAVVGSLKVSAGGGELRAWVRAVFFPSDEMRVS